MNLMLTDTVKNSSNTKENKLVPPHGIISLEKDQPPTESITQPTLYTTKPTLDTILLVTI